MAFVTFTRPADGEVCIFPRYNWWNRIESIQQIDPATRTITLKRPMPYAARGEDRYAVFGMKEELDAPGEWYLDRKAGILFFWPPAAGEATGRTPSMACRHPRPSLSRAGSARPPTAAATCPRVSAPSSPYAPASGSAPQPTESSRKRFASLTEASGIRSYRRYT